ncbi:HAD family hydrolase [Streptomyces polygonati]|uniref:HAD family hydrolase n=1 Tax=Streptomyces polygonati TaxID=1617087 RepID=A0ABV8HMJ3_9ACTN
MPGFSGIALDVGGVIYYDEPFELTWLQEMFDRASAGDTAITLDVFLRHIERFYRQDGSTRPWRAPGYWDPVAAESWAAVRTAWAEIAQEIPGARRAVRDIAARFPTVVVANQPPECLDVLDRWGLTGVLRAVLLDSLTGVAKPDPGLLDLGRARLGLRSAEVLMVGNRVDHDIRPALALGCGAVFIRGDSAYRPPAGVHPELVAGYERWRAIRTAPPGPGEAVAIVSSLAELAERTERAASAEPTASAAPGDAGPTAAESTAASRVRGSGRR